MQSQMDDQQAQIGQVTGEAANIRTELPSSLQAKTDIVTNRLKLASTNAKLQYAAGDLNGQSHLNARIREQLENLGTEVTAATVNSR